MNADVLGRRIAFPPRLSDRNRLGLVEGDAAIRQAIYVIIYTVPGERVMRPDFGCRIHELIFAPANDETTITAARYVREAIEMWEPRIDLTDVVVTPGSFALGELYIEVRYKLKDYPDERSLVYPYYLIPQAEGE